MALIGGGAALYFFKFKKPKADTKGGDELDEYDFGEDEDDEDDYDDPDDCDGECSGCCGCGDEIEYEVTCPQCGKTLTVYEDDLDFGSIRCPECDAELEFDLDHDDDGSDE